MARITVIHRTEYTYRDPVGLMRHRLMVRPDDSHDLRLHSAELRVSPEPSAVLWKHDVFDNSVCILEWPEDLRTDQLTIVSTLDLTHHPDGPPLPCYILEPGAKDFPFSYARPEIADLAHLAERQMPDPGRKVEAWARRVVAAAGTNDTLKVLEAITRAIKKEFRYGQRHEEGTQSAARTIELGTGTCRDFAVLMMEALRGYGLATRFVTGYLYDDVSGETRGGGSTHAWCGVYLPGAGWVEYDPTNGLIAGANLIRVGATREAAQAIPISGSFVGNADDPIGMHVDVSVRAVPTC
ncbi:transglutaminase family protein [Amaricoccus solimangrovi]|uniref:Transglutaminase family protein n=1 Tax=Amaricoccus solimangrovi TaxID=2589815 RepID=A0A501WF98_9RHOB|nr:transglutaminase family protein [Amaricoccus solimangrovi]TPE45657.1 transglutaminase family protein [Amaricoccus solimangrovi]